MAFSYNKSTYQNLIDEVLDEIKDENVHTINPETMQGWILDAETLICDQIQVRDQWRLRLLDDQKNYAFRDRPAITAVTTSPLTVTCASHGLLDDEYIFTEGIGGIPDANGHFIVTAKTTDTFQMLKYAIVTNASNESPIVITTRDAHEYSTGDSITNASIGGNTAANGTFTITKITATTFSLDGSTGNGTYTSGGVAKKTPSVTGTYTDGGRVWNINEIPTYFKKFLYGVRYVNNFVYGIRPADMSESITIQIQNSLAYPFSEWDSPYKLSEWIESGKRYLQAYPAPLEDDFVDLFLAVKISKRLYTSDDLSLTIHLSTDYDEAIRRYLSYKIFDRLGNDVKSDKKFFMYKDEIGNLQRAFPSELKQKIVYW